MAIDLKKMQSKLDALKNKGSAAKTNFWSPKEGNTYNVRIVPTPDGDPFKEFWFHYEVGKAAGFLCPKKNFGESCAVCEFASKLYKEKNEESAKLAKKFLARQRFFSAVLVRGEEAEGLKVWGYGKNAYQELINLVLNPDYGDITDVEGGTDLSLRSEKAKGQSFAMTKITPARKTSRLCNSPTECQEIMDQLPDFEAIHSRKTTDEVAAILAEALASPANEAETEEASRETTRFGGGVPAVTSKAGRTAPRGGNDDIDSAFADLMS
jgi:hypothetical protein